MIESSRNQDEALRYVLGELRKRERRKFEARLENSSELRASVRELQEGMLALTLSMPQREPPGELLTAVRSAVAKERTRAFRLFTRAALFIALPLAACLVGGFVLSAIWLNGRHKPTEPDAAAATVNSNVSSAPVTSMTVNAARSESTHTNSVRRLSRTEAPVTKNDIASLRYRVTELNTKVAQLSRELDSQYLLSAASSQLKLLQLSSPGAEATESVSTAPPSVEEQRLLLLALARQLGWVRPTSTGKSSPSAKISSLSPGEGTDSRVDFVDLNPNDPDYLQDANSQASGKPDADGSNLPGTTNSSIPGFVFGTNLVFVLDPARLPATSGPLRIRYSNDNDGTSTSIPINLGSNPVIVSTPVGNSPGDGHTIAITSGASNTLGQFPPVETGGH